MNLERKTANCLLVASLLVAAISLRTEAKSYSSGGGHSYSSSHSSSSGGSHSHSAGSSSGFSHSSSGGASHSSSSPGGSSKSSETSTSRSSKTESHGASKSFTSGSGKSYGSGSASSDDSRRGYSSAKSYTSGLAPPSTFTFDNPAARARKEEASRQEFSRFKESSSPRPPAIETGGGTVPGTPIVRSTVPEATPSAVATPSYRVTPPPLPPSSTGSYRRPEYVPDANTIFTRPARTHTVFAPYVSRPVVVYRDSYNSLFWWWLLDRTLDDRAYWAYHHRYDMDPARYQALVADNHQLEERITQLETQQVTRDPNYVPPGLDHDLMYSDHHMTRAYTNRPTISGTVAFWVIAIPLGLAAGYFFIWLVFMKRWQPAT